MIINVLKHLITFSDKTPQLFLYHKEKPQLNFQHYKSSTYKLLTYVNLRHVLAELKLRVYFTGFLVEGIFKIHF